MTTDNKNGVTIGMDGSTSILSTFLKNMIAGGLAGTSVDVALFPIDTVKTRLQSPDGFWKSGGFRGIYRGIGAAAVGSAPGASLFFTTYEVGTYFSVCISLASVMCVYGSCLVDLDCTR